MRGGGTGVNNQIVSVRTSVAACGWFYAIVCGRIRKSIRSFCTNITSKLTLIFQQIFVDFSKF